MNSRNIRRILYFIAAWAFALLAGFAFSKYPAWWSKPVSWAGGATATVAFILALGGDDDPQNEAVAATETQAAKNEKKKCES